MSPYKEIGRNNIAFYGIGPNKNLMRKAYIVSNFNTTNFNEFERTLNIHRDAQKRLITLVGKGKSISEHMQVFESSKKSIIRSLENRSLPKTGATGTNSCVDDRGNHWCNVYFKILKWKNGRGFEVHTGLTFTPWGALATGNVAGLDSENTERRESAEKYKAHLERRVKISKELGEVLYRLP